MNMCYLELEQQKDDEWELNSVFDILSQFFISPEGKVENHVRIVFTLLSHFFDSKKAKEYMLFLYSLLLQQIKS